MHLSSSAFCWLKICMSQQVMAWLLLGWTICHTGCCTILLLQQNTVEREIYTRCTFTVLADDPTIAKLKIAKSFNSPVGTALCRALSQKKELRKFLLEPLVAFRKSLQLQKFPAIRVHVQQIKYRDIIMQVSQPYALTQPPATSLCEFVSISISLPTFPFSLLHQTQSL